MLIRIVILAALFVSDVAVSDANVYELYVAEQGGMKESRLYCSSVDLTGNGLRDYLIASDMRVAASGIEYSLYIQEPEGQFRHAGNINAVGLKVVSLPRKDVRGIIAAEKSGINETFSSVYFVGSDGSLKSFAYKTECKGPKCESDYDQLLSDEPVEADETALVRSEYESVEALVSAEVFSRLYSNKDELCTIYFCTDSSSYKNPDRYSQFKNAYTRSDAPKFVGVVDWGENQFVDVYQDDQGYWKVKQYLGVRPPVLSSSAAVSSSQAAVSSAGASSSLASPTSSLSSSSVAAQSDSLVSSNNSTPWLWLIAAFISFALGGVWYARRRK